MTKTELEALHLTVLTAQFLLRQATDKPEFLLQHMDRVAEFCDGIDDILPEDVKVNFYNRYLRELESRGFKTT